MLQGEAPRGGRGGRQEENKERDRLKPMLKRLKTFRLRDDEARIFQKWKCAAWGPFSRCWQAF